MLIPKCVPKVPKRWAKDRRKTAQKQYSKTGIQFCLDMVLSGPCPTSSVVGHGLDNPMSDQPSPCPTIQVWTLLGPSLRDVCALLPSLLFKIFLGFVHYNLGQCLPTLNDQLEDHNPWLFGMKP